MSKYLMIIKFDQNDGDYAYGLKVVTEEEKKALEAKPKKIVCLGYSELGAERKAKDVFSFKKITSDEENVLRKFGLDDFGEGKSFEIEEFLED